ncbi:hypothetical protein E4U38_003591 [Claviceps purpurea]|nr:hypothetical protein E4U38_003591 [Claviceps purpurea]
MTLSPSGLPPDMPIFVLLLKTPMTKTSLNHLRPSKVAFSFQTPPPLIRLESVARGALWLMTLLSGAVPPSKKKKGMPISEMLDDQLPEAVPLVREKLVEERPRRVRGSNFVVKLIAVEIHQSSQLIEREPDWESMSCHSSKEPLIG